MLQVRIHGRGGQGVVTAAELLALAAFDEGRYAQAFPSFGSERMGAPVMSFCRIDDQRSGPRSRSPNRTPCSSSPSGWKRRRRRHSGTRGHGDLSHEVG